MSLYKGIIRRGTKNKSLISGSFKLIALRVLSLGVSYLFTLLLSRIYGASVMGLYAMTSVVIMVSVLLTRAGMDTYFLRTLSDLLHKKKFDEGRSVYSSIMALQVIIGLIVSVGLFLFAPWISLNVFKEPTLLPILKLASFVIIPSAWNSLHGEGFRARKKLFSYISLTRIWPFLLGSVAMMVLSRIGEGNEYYFFAFYFISIGLTSLFGLVKWNLTEAFRFRQLSIRRNFGRIVFQAMPMMMASSMFLIMSWTDTLMLGIFESSESVGSYHVAVKVSNIVSIVLFGVNGIVAPKLSSSFGSNNLKEFNQIVTSSASLSFLLSTPLICAIIFFRSELLGLFGPTMTMASIALVVLAIGQFVNASCGSVMNILQMTHNQTTGQYILMSAALINIILNLILIPQYGIEGAAASTAISTIFWNLASVIAVRLKLKVWSVPFSYSFIKRIKKVLASFG